MTKLRSNRIGAAALILASGWRLQYRTLRCAALCFDRVYVLGTKESRPLARSSVCQAFHALSPDAPTFSAANAHLVNELCMRWSIDCILPSDADTTHFVGKYRSEFAARSFPVPNADTFDLLNNKYTFTKLCQKLDVPTPETYLVANRAELFELLALGTLRPPIVVKPLDMWGSYGVHVLKTNDTQPLATKIGYEPILVQQYIDGLDVCAFFVCSKGIVQATALYRPGPNALHYIQNDRLQDQCLKVIQHCEYDGVIGFDIRDNGSESFFLECNPQFWLRYGFYDDGRHELRRNWPQRSPQRIHDYARGNVNPEAVGLAPLQARFVVWRGKRTCHDLVLLVRHTDGLTGSRKQADADCWLGRTDGRGPTRSAGSAWIGMDRARQEYCHARV